MDIREKQRLCSLRRKELIEKATEPELRVKSLLETEGIKFIFQKGLISGNNFCIADFYIPRFKTIIEIDGGYHTTDKQIKRDKQKDNYYAWRNFRVLRITNEQAMSIDAKSLKDLIYRAEKPNK